MGRRPRIEFAGALHHVAVQGNLQRPLFENDAERATLLRLLGQSVERYRWLCLSYALMTNHVHLVVRTPEPTLAEGMRRMNTMYSKAMTARGVRLGHMLRNRYLSVAVTEGSHELELTRYLPLNPVRAGLAVLAEQYRWSSYAAELGLAGAPRFLTVGWAVRLHGSPERLRRYVARGMTEPGVAWTPGSDPTLSPPRREG